MILDHTYFQGELSLPGLKLNAAFAPVGHAATNIQTVSELNLDWFINKYESEFLRELLGESLAEKFISEMKEADPAEIWVNLRDAIYKDGLSPAANYVYFHVKRDGRTQSSLTGEKVGSMDYADNANDANKLVKAWNDMCVMVERFYCGFLKKNWNDYKEYSDGCIRCNSFRTINAFGI